MEVQRVDVDEEVLNVGVWVKTSEHPRQFLQTDRHFVVRSETDRDPVDLLTMNTQWNLSNYWPITKKKKKTVLLDIFEHCTIFYTVFYDELI